MFMKRKYVKPSVKVYQLELSHQLLQYSGWNAEAPGISGIGNDMNKLA